MNNKVLLIALTLAAFSHHSFSVKKNEMSHSLLEKGLEELHKASKKAYSPWEHLFLQMG